MTLLLQSLAGFPRSSFGGSRSSVHASQHGLAQGYEDNQVRIRREGPGELERLNYSRRSRSNSGASGAFDGNEIEYRESVSFELLLRKVDPCRNE